jgi:hypothetical protein
VNSTCAPNPQQIGIRGATRRRRLDGLQLVWARPSLGAALTADRKIDVEEAERQLGARLDFGRSVGKRIASAGPVPEAPEPAFNEMEELRLSAARRKDRAEREVEFLRRGVYSLTQDMRRTWTRELQAQLTITEQRFPELAAALGFTGAQAKTAVVIIRPWHRSLRFDQSVAASERASRLPDLVQVDSPLEPAK